MLRVSGVTKCFGNASVISDISFDIEQGEIVGLVGASGAGKSTLLKILGGVMQPDTGRVSRTDGGDIVAGLLFQEAALFDSMTVLDNVAFPLLEYGDRKRGDYKGGMLTTGMTRIRARELAYEALIEVGLSDACYKYPGHLSGGMRRRAGIARALVAHSALVLLDDPTGGLDPVAASVIMNLITSLHASYGFSVIMVSHDIRRLLPRVNRVIALEDGRVACDLPTQQLKESAPKSIFDFLSSRYDFDGANLRKC